MTEKMSRQNWAQFAQQWQRAGPVLENLRRQALQSLEHDAEGVDAVLAVGDSLGSSRPSSGLVEMQRWFLKLAERQGLVPKPVVREERSEYGKDVKAD